MRINYEEPNRIINISFTPLQQSDQANLVHDSKNGIVCLWS